MRSKNENEEQTLTLIYLWVLKIDLTNILRYLARTKIAETAPIYHQINDFSSLSHIYTCIILTIFLYRWQGNSNKPTRAGGMIAKPWTFWTSSTRVCTISWCRSLKSFLGITPLSFWIRFCVNADRLWYQPACPSPPNKCYWPAIGGHLHRTAILSWQYKKMRSMEPTRNAIWKRFINRCKKWPVEASLASWKMLKSM